MKIRVLLLKVYALEHKRHCNSSILSYLLWQQISELVVMFRAGCTHRWHCSWPLQHSAAVGIPRGPLPSGSLHLLACDWREMHQMIWFITACELLALSALSVLDWTDVTKCGCPPTVPSSFSRNVKSLASPGRRHSSSWSRKEHQSNTTWLFIKNKPLFSWIIQQLWTTASPYQNGDDAFELFLHQVTDDLVVKILHRLPLHHGKFNAKLHKHHG